LFADFAIGFRFSIRRLRQNYRLAQMFCDILARRCDAMDNIAAPASHHNKDIHHTNSQTTKYTTNLYLQIMTTTAAPSAPTMDHSTTIVDLSTTVPLSSTSSKKSGLTTMRDSKIRATQIVELVLMKKQELLKQTQELTESEDTIQAEVKRADELMDTYTKSNDSIKADLEFACEHRAHRMDLVLDEIERNAKKDIVPPQLPPQPPRRAQVSCKGIRPSPVVTTTAPTAPQQAATTPVHAMDPMDLKPLSPTATQNSADDALFSDDFVSVMFNGAPTQSLIEHTAASACELANSQYAHGHEMVPSNKRARPNYVLTRIESPAMDAIRMLKSADAKYLTMSEMESFRTSLYEI
jgi:hypothetical protein